MLFTRETTVYDDTRPLKHEKAQHLQLRNTLFFFLHFFENRSCLFFFYVCVHVN